MSAVSLSLQGRQSPHSCHYCCQMRSTLRILAILIHQDTSK
ncbi:hypothetical protein ANCCAN_20926 [Ancylostoma caninum]|uniref:Uncharacterized protein n=1 Tax=Ancylostoma caninum TaxID=29170 RepID=A0A368FSN8_ANCCA|nr:hypothetical protein ANCCAN_20926 [Ancylostoma caninum]